MGGILLGNYLSREGPRAAARLRAAMLLSCCFDTFKGSESLERPGLNRMLNHHLASCLVGSVRRVRHHFSHQVMISIYHDAVLVATTSLVINLLDVCLILRKGGGGAGKGGKQDLATLSCYE